MLPATLDIVDTLAASLAFDGSLTARDRSLLFAVSWYAGQHPPEPGTDTMVPDLPLRRALGDMRRPDEVKEFARYQRLEHATMKTDETLPDLADGALVPTVPGDMRRITIGGKRAWIVEPGIVRSFQLLPGDSVVGVPLAVLAKARSRYTLPLLLRLLAWGSGAYPKKWFRREREGFFVLRIPIADMRTAIGSDPGVYPVDVMRKEILPAVDELRAYADLQLDIEAVHAPSLRRKNGGRVMSFDLLLPKIARRVVAMPERTAPTAEIIAFPTRGFTPFKPRPLPTVAAAPKPVAPPADYAGW